jgi:hypothetical protein
MTAPLRFGVLLTAALLASSGCKKDGCDEKGLDRVLAALSKVEVKDHSELIAQGLLDVCGKEASVPMPASLMAALTAVREYSAGSAAALILKAGKDDPALWSKACPAGASGIDVVLKAKPRFESLELARACGAEARGYASEAEFGQAYVGDVALSLLAHAWLKDGGTDPVRASRLAKAILEIE